MTKLYTLVNCREATYLASPNPVTVLSAPKSLVRPKRNRTLITMTKMIMFKIRMAKMGPMQKDHPWKYIPMSLMTAFERSTATIGSPQERLVLRERYDSLNYLQASPFLAWVQYNMWTNVGGLGMKLM